MVIDTLCSSEATCFVLNFCVVFVFPIIVRTKIYFLAHRNFGASARRSDRGRIDPILCPLALFSSYIYIGGYVGGWPPLSGPRPALPPPEAGDQEV